MTITVICQYITNRFREYETIVNFFGSPTLKPKEPKLPRLPAIDITTGASTTEDGEGARGPGGRSGRGGRGGKGRRGGCQVRSKWPDTMYPANVNTGSPPHGKKRNEKPIPSCTFCVPKKSPPNPHYIGGCPWISAATKSDLLTTLPNFCLGCLRQKTAEEHNILTVIRKTAETDMSARSASSIQRFVNHPQPTLKVSYRKLL